MREIKKEFYVENEHEKKKNKAKHSDVRKQASDALVLPT